MRVTILHPDLGIGGAERLIVDAAVALKRKGHQVKIVTNHYDPTHCFEETKDLDIETVASWFPRSFLDMFFALFAYIKMCIAALYVCWRNDSDVILSDQVSASLFVLRSFSRARRVFYCHFPDLLLTDRQNPAKALYRVFLDAIEEKTTSMADVVCVNSLFTARVVRKTFPSVAQRPLEVLYPTLNTNFFDKAEPVPIPEIPDSAEFIFVSLNRFEVKKNIILAIDAFVCLEARLSKDLFDRCFLVIAGGFDRKNQENLIYHAQLREYIVENGVATRHYAFLRSPGDAQKVELLRRATAVLYTPSNEHFGIVPVEAMYLKAPVIAVNSGGPMETVIDDSTGYLVEPTAEAFAAKMEKLVREKGLRERLGDAGHQRVLKNFAFESFADKLNAIVTSQ